MFDDGGNAQTSRGRYAQALFGVAFAGAAANAEVSPLRNARSADAPILLVHGKDDTVVPFVHSLSMNDVLLKARKTVTFVPLDGEDHFWSHQETRVRILQETVGFVEKYNPPG
jgi:dipeptidyl aminopeptidase/acylaminoacyl peptidase